MAKVSVGLDLGGREGQHAISRQRAGDVRLLHIGREAVPAMEFTGDVPMVILSFIVFAMDFHKVIDDLHAQILRGEMFYIQKDCKFVPVRSHLRNT